MLYAHLQHHNDTIIKTQWQRQTQEDFFDKIFTSHFIGRVRKGLLKVCMWEGVEDRTETVIFWPHCYDRQRCVLLVLRMLGSTLLRAGFLYCILSASSLDPNSSGPQAPSAWCGFPYHISSPTLLPLARRTQLALNSTQLSSFCSIHQPYITSKLPRGDMDTPPQFLPISGNRDVSLPLSLEWPVWSSSRGITVMQFRGHSLPVRQSMRV